MKKEQKKRQLRASNMRTLFIYPLPVQRASEQVGQTDISRTDRDQFKKTDV